MIFVDDTEQVNDCKYAYRNCQGDIEYVELYDTDIIAFVNAAAGQYDAMSEIFASDIPKMIKALEAAYAQYMQCKI